MVRPRRAKSFITKKSKNPTTELAISGPEYKQVFRVEETYIRKGASTWRNFDAEGRRIEMDGTLIPQLDPNNVAGCPTLVWSNLGALRAAVDAGGEGRSALVGLFDARDAAHRDTLLALGSEERRALFVLCSRANWGRFGLLARAAQLAQDLAKRGHMEAALGLFDDLVVIAGVPPQAVADAIATLEAAFPAVARARERRDVYVRRAHVVGPWHATVFLEAARLELAAGARAAAAIEVERALRYGVDVALVRDDARLAPFIPEARAPGQQLTQGTLGLARLLRSECDPLHATPPSALRVARRALLLAAMAWRASLPSQQPLVSPEFLREAKTRQASLLAWLSAQGIAEEAEPDEWAYLVAPLEPSQSGQDIDLSWAIEAAAILGWALGRQRLPPYEAKVDPDVLVTRLGLGTDLGTSSLRDAMLAPVEARWRFARQILAIDWRVTEALVRPGPMHLSNPSDDILARLDFRYGRLRDGDLLVASKPIAAAPQTKIRRLKSIALERHRAASWLVGLGGGRWSDAEIET